MKSQKVQTPVIARSLATKQSPEIKHLQNTRLLRSARNDYFGDFLRDHQTKEFKNFEFGEFEFVLRQAQDGEQSRTISDFDIRISNFLN